MVSQTGSALPLPETRRYYMVRLRKTLSLAVVISLLMVTAVGLTGCDNMFETDSTTTETTAGNSTQKDKENSSNSSTNNSLSKNKFWIALYKPYVNAAMSKGYGYMTGMVGSHSITVNDQYSTSPYTSSYREYSSPGTYVWSTSCKYKWFTDSLTNFSGGLSSDGEWKEKTVSQSGTYTFKGGHKYTINVATGTVTQTQ